MWVWSVEEVVLYHIPPPHPSSIPRGAYLSTSHERAPPPECVEVVRLVVVVRGRDKVPEKVTSSSESEGLRDSKHCLNVQHKG